MRMRLAVVVGALALAAAAAAPAVAKTRGALGVEPVKILPEDRLLVLEGNEIFAFDVYERLRGEPGNLVFSPFSLSAALTMLTPAARGETRDQLLQALHLEPLSDRLDAAVQSVLGELRPDEGSRYRLDVANALWVARQIPFRRGFVDTLRTHYGARAASLDFQRNWEGARGRINRWGARITHGLVREALNPGDITDLTAFVVVNAVSFDAKWATPFPLASTRDAPFMRGDGTTVQSKLMRARSDFAWFDGDGFVAVELPYRGDEVSMTLLVPDTHDGLPALEAALTPANLATWTAGLAEDDVIVYLPRFGYASDLNLGDTLRGLGVTDAFDRALVDLSGAAGAPGDIVLSLVRQKARIEVTELGTRAAAVTSAVAEVTSAPPVIAADRPFLYLIRHRPTGTILFLGRVEDPTQ